MTIRPGYEERMRDLHRTAPYIDVEELREKMAQAALETIRDRGIPTSNSHTARVRAFADGEGHTLPDRWGLSDKLYNFLRQATTYPDDGLHAAHKTFQNYFFATDYDLGITRRTTVTITV